MSRPLNVCWQDRPEELEQAYKREYDGKVKIRLYALWQICIGNSVKSVSKAIGYSYNAVLRWLDRYRAEGISGVNDRKGRGRKCQISREEIVEMRNMALSGELPTFNKYIEDLLEKEKLIEQKLREYWDDPKSLVRLTFHPWIREQWTKIQKLISRYNI